MLTYKDIDQKKAYVFELDDVLYPEKDYLLQIYFLFGSFIEYIEAKPSKDIVAFLKEEYELHGADGIFEKVAARFGLEAKYKENFERLHTQGKLPLELLLFPPMLTLLQEMVIDRKQIFIITNGDPLQQLNKIKYINWQGLQKYLTIYFAAEFKPKPDTLSFDAILEKSGFLRKEILVIGATSVDEEFAAACGCDFVYADEFGI